MQTIKIINHAFMVDNHFNESEKLNPVSTIRSTFTVIKLQSKLQKYDV